MSLHLIQRMKSFTEMNVLVHTLLQIIVMFYICHCDSQGLATEDFKVDCIRPLGMRITPSANFRVLQTGCRSSESTILLEPPYDVSGDCLIATDTGTAVQIILEDSTSSNDLVGGFKSRVFVVSCDFPGSEGYKETVNRPMPAIEQPAGVDPTATSGVFKYTGILMAIIDKATFTAARWAQHLMSSAFIGQELYLTISHPQGDEGQAFIIPRQCRVKPETGNFTTIWNYDSKRRQCYEVRGIAREPVRVFTDTTNAEINDVLSLQFFGFQFLGYENDIITFECDLLLCGDVTRGTCQNEWKALQNQRDCITTKPPPHLQQRPPPPQGMQIPPEKRQRMRRHALPDAMTASYIRNYGNSNDNYQIQQETVRVNVRMLMPRTRLQHVASGNTIFPSSAVALLLTSFVRLFQEG